MGDEGPPKTLVKPDGSRKDPWTPDEQDRQQMVARITKQVTDSMSKTMESQIKSQLADVHKSLKSDIQALAPSKKRLRYNDDSWGQFEDIDEEFCDEDTEGGYVEDLEEEGEILEEGEFEHDAIPVYLRNEAYLKNIVAQYQAADNSQKLLDKTTEPLQKDLPLVLEKWFCGHFSNEDVKAKLEGVAQPANVDVIIPCRINDEVYQRLPAEVKNGDRDMRYINNAVTKAAQPLCQVWSTLIMVIGVVKQQKPPDAPALIKRGEHTVLYLDACKKHLDDALQILGMVNSNLSRSTGQV